MQLISKFSGIIFLLLCFIDIFSEYASIISLRDKKGATIVSAFQKVLNKSDHKPNK